MHRNDERLVGLLLAQHEVRPLHRLPAELHDIGAPLGPPE
jgi:hypothetical protein